MDSTATEKTKAQHNFAHRLLHWYEAKAREMPWRIPPHDHAAGVRANPYHVWLSEVMLQQTQVATVRSYFLNFIDQWPTVEALAAAAGDDVMKAWAGLGYYSRARNLKKCAEIIAESFSGRFPQTVSELKKLPGIGDYTASAIAAIAFDEAVAVLDGNVERVLARHRLVETPFPQAKPEATKILEGLFDKNKPGEFAQAMMDLGATICTPRNPKCGACPLNSDCNGYSKGIAEDYPRKLPKREKPVRKGAAYVIVNGNNEVFLRKRPDIGMLGGMTEVPTTNWSIRGDGATGVDEAPVSADWILSGAAHHTFTHFHLQLEVWKTVFQDDVPIEGWWCQTDDTRSEALPTLIRKVLKVAGIQAG